MSSPQREKEIYDTAIMKIIIVGASGNIGSKVVDALSDRHDIVRVGAHSGDVQCDYTDK
jgi:nucleoside-diphosphate-sugar epimerase